MQILWLICVNCIQHGPPFVHVLTWIYSMSRWLWRCPYMCCRYRGERVLPAPRRGAVWPVEAPAPVYPGGSEDFQDFHQDNSGGSTDHHLLCSGARSGQPEWSILQVHTVFQPTCSWLYKSFQSAGFMLLSITTCWRTKGYTVCSWGSTLFLI